MNHESTVTDMEVGKHDKKDKNEKKETDPEEATEN